MLIPFSIADFRIISLICEPWMWVPALSGMKEVMHEIGSRKVYPRFKMLCLILFPVKDIRKYAFLTHHNIVVKKWFSDFVTPMTQVGVSVYVSVSKLKRQSLTDLITQWQGHLLSCPVQLDTFFCPHRNTGQRKYWSWSFSLPPTLLHDYWLSRTEWVGMMDPNLQSKCYLDLFSNHDFKHLGVLI